MIRIDDLEVFVNAARSGSFSAAARGLDITPAWASGAVQRLEREVGARLFVRSTRKMRLSEEGERYLPHAEAVLAAVAEGRQALVRPGAEIAGPLRISMPSDLGRQMTQLTVIGTASRPETVDWVRNLGAHHVIDHSRPLSEELRRIGVPHVHYVASLTQTDTHLAEIVESLIPQGRLALIDDPAPFDVKLLKRKSISLHWELMFTRAIYETPDMIAQHRILEELATLLDRGTLRSTLAEHYGTINADNLRRAHALIESGAARGKIVLEGWE